jgi:hypothetical protein
LTGWCFGNKYPAGYRPRLSDAVEEYGVPPGFSEALATVGGRTVSGRREGRRLLRSLPAGSQRFIAQAK